MTDHRKTAVYIRLSAEDDNVDGRAKKESDSVTSQRILLKSFVIDQLGVDEADILEYVDDGVSGTHFKRQGFQQLQDDMKSGEIGCVVVKDFSRFGRDYLEVGFYIEYIFPLLQIRFISINDSYDSAASSGMTGGMNVALQNLVYNMYSLDLSKKISSAMQTRTKNGTRLPVNARYGYKKGKDGRLEVDPEAAKVVKMIFQMAAEGTSFADITRELNRQAIATCDEQKLSRGDQVQFQRFDTIKKKHWSPTTVSAIVRDEIYIGTRIWGKTRCSMHTGHKAVLNDETEWVRLENHHTAIIDRELFEKANEMHPKKKRSVAESRTNFTLERRKKQPALLICAKSFLSRQKETYKVPYETHPADRLRQCVFGGTTNRQDFLPRDRTGNRRFLPVTVYPERAEVHILDDEAAARAYIEQMWAEAMTVYRSGKYKLSFSMEMNRYLNAHQQDFMQEDTQAGMIYAYLEDYTGDRVCSKQLYEEALGNLNSPADWETRAICEIMNTGIAGGIIQGWAAYKSPKRYKKYGSQKGWERVNQAPPEGDGFQEITEEEARQMELPF
ncbi:recombinase family protein [Coprococcus comes]